MSYRKRTVILLVSLLVAVLLLVLFICRGWVRSTLVPAYANIFYKQNVAKYFDQDLTPVNAKLSQLGFTFTDTAPQRYARHTCSEAPTIPTPNNSQAVTCTKAQSNYKRAFTEAFAATWKRDSAAFEAYLLQNGWHKERNQQQPIDQIYDNTNNTASVGVVYSKTRDTTRCELSIVYFATFADREKTFVHESCSQNIVLFS
jgi:hypothetical protein